MNLGRPEYLTLSVSANKFHPPQASLRCSAWLALFFLGSLLSGCGAPLLALGGSSTAAASSVGTSAATVALANPVTASSLASSAVTGKSPLEHIASAATKKECNFLNALGPKPICEEILVPQVTDYSAPYLGLADMEPVPAKK